MEITGKDFLELMEKVEDAGGVLGPDSCQPKRYTLKTEKDGRVLKTESVMTTGCHNETIFMIPYEKHSGGTETVIACAVDDDIARWPRFQNKLQEEE